MTSSLQGFLYLSLLEIIVHQSKALAPKDPTEGFISLPLNQSSYHIEKPYDVPLDQRYQFTDGVHRLWVYSTDKPHTRTSQTKARTELTMDAYHYSSGVWQFEGYGYVPSGTSGVCIMQIFGASPPRASTAMVRVYNGSLTYYRSSILASNIYDNWFRLNIIHDANAAQVKIFINGVPKLEVEGRGGISHNFKWGVYAQIGDSSRMESRWKGIKVLKKVD